jgi:hypothetical protein
MPDLGQVRTAAYRVMRVHGLAGVTIAAVSAQMRNDGVKAGSDRDLSVMVRAWKAEQQTVAALPSHVVEMAQKLAQTVWEIALATAAELEAQHGGADEEPARIRQPRQVAKARAGIALLQKGIEALLREDAEDPFVQAPTARDIYRTLPKRLQSLTDEAHVNRVLLEVEKRSAVVMRLADGRWWRRDRPTPPGRVDEGRRSKSYKRSGTAGSLTRTANEATMNDAVAVLLDAGRGMENKEVAAALDIPPEKRKRFYEMLRNHLRAKKENQRFRLVDGKYEIIRTVGKKS